MQSIRVAVIDELPIFRRGLVACLSEDSSITIKHVSASGGLISDCDVVVCSELNARIWLFRAPLVVCANSPTRSSEFGGNAVAAVLSRADTDANQLHAAIHAAASGLSVARIVAPSLDTRSLDVLRLLADGAATREISGELGYSERTIKSVIFQAKVDLGVRNRAQAVASAIRQGLI